MFPTPLRVSNISVFYPAAAFFKFSLYAGKLVHQFRFSIVAHHFVILLCIIQPKMHGNFIIATGNKTGQKPLFNPMSPYATHMGGFGGNKTGLK